MTQTKSEGLQRVRLLDCGHWTVNYDSDIIKIDAPHFNPIMWEGETPCPFCKELRKVCRSIELLGRDTLVLK